MKPDTYTKVLLTIIASCLLIQVIRPLTVGQLRVKAQESNRSNVRLTGVAEYLLNDKGNALRVIVVNPKTDPVIVDR